MTAPLIPGFYNLQFGLAFPGVDGAEPNVKLPTPDPLYLTRSGDGKQLTLEKKISGNINQEVNYYTKFVPCTYPLTCFCVAVGHPATFKGR